MPKQPVAVTLLLVIVVPSENEVNMPFGEAEVVFALTVPVLPKLKIGIPLFGVVAPMFDKVLFEKLNVSPGVVLKVEYRPLKKMFLTVTLFTFKFVKFPVPTLKLVAIPFLALTVPPAGPSPSTVRVWIVTPLATIW